MINFKTIFMKKILFIIFFSHGFLSNYAQEFNKESLCESAAFSIVHSVAPALELKMPKSQVEEVGKEEFKEVAHTSIGKTYDLLSSGKSRKEVIRIIYLDFMKLDDEIVKKGFIKELTDINDD